MKNIESIKITLNVNEDFHSFIEQEQQKIKKNTGKKVSLSSIVLDFAIKGIKKEANNQFTQKNEQLEQNKETITQNYNLFTHNLEQNRTISLKSVSIKQLKELEQKLIEKEDKLRDLEFELNDRYDELFEKQNSAIELKEQALLKIQEVENLKMIVLLNKSELKVLKAENKYLKAEQIRKEELHFKEKEKVMLRFDNVKDVVSNIEKSNERLAKTLVEAIQIKKEITPFNYILQLLPYGAMLLLFLKKDNKSNELEEFKNELRKTYNQLSNSEKLKLRASATGGLVEKFLK